MYLKLRIGKVTRRRRIWQRKSQKCIEESNYDQINLMNSWRKTLDFDLLKLFERLKMKKHIKISILFMFIRNLNNLVNISSSISIQKLPVSKLLQFLLRIRVLSFSKLRLKEILVLRLALVEHLEREDWEESIKFKFKMMVFLLLCLERSQYRFSLSLVLIFLVLDHS